MRENLEWHLTPIIKWDNLNKTFPIRQPLDPGHWNHQQSGEFVTTLILILTGFGLILILMARKIMEMLFRKIRNPKRIRTTGIDDKAGNSMELKAMEKQEEEDSIHIQI